MTRYECLSILAPFLNDEDLVVTALGWVAGEWHALRPAESNLYQINMGMCTPVSLGLALSLPHRRVIALTTRSSSFRNDNQITFFDNHPGSGIQFAAVAYRLYELAKERGLGREIPTDWFLQDIRD